MNEMNETEELEQSYPDPEPPEDLEPSEEPTPNSQEELNKARALFESLDPTQQMEVVSWISETRGGVQNLLELMQPSENGSNEDPLAEEISLILTGVRQVREAQIFEVQEAKTHRAKMEARRQREEIEELKQSLENLHKKVNVIIKHLKIPQQ